MLSHSTRGRAAARARQREAFIPPHSRTLTGGFALGLLVAGLAGCSRDKASENGEISPSEHAAFQAPADSSLTPEQVDRYLRTALGQFDILRAEAPATRKQLAAMRRDSKPAVSAPPGAKRPKSQQALWGDFVDATYVRAARKLGYNPAELWYVRHRISAAGGHLLAGEMQGSKSQAASLFRQQAEAMRGAPGVTQAQIDAMLKAAAQAEGQEPVRAVPPRLAQNVEALRRARGEISDAAWGRVAGVAAGVGVTDLGRIPDGQIGRKLDELTTLYQAALANREPPPS